MEKQNSDFNNKKFLFFSFRRIFLKGSNQEGKIVIMIMRRDFRFHLVVNDYYLS